MMCVAVSEFTPVGHVRHWGPTVTSVTAPNRALSCNVYSDLCVIHLFRSPKVHLYTLELGHFLWFWWYVFFLPFGNWVQTLGHLSVIKIGSACHGCEILALFFGGQGANRLTSQILHKAVRISVRWSHNQLLNTETNIAKVACDDILSRQDRKNWVQNRLLARK